MLTTFKGILGFPIEIGQIFVIGGRTIDGADRLDINLSTNKAEDISYALQLSVRFNEEIIVRNTLMPVDGWGRKEIKENLHDGTTSNPILAGENFQVYILIGDSKFHISINNDPFCSYAYRMPIEEIRSIIVNKDVQSITQIDHRQAFPHPHPVIQFDNPMFVFSNDVPKPFIEGHVIIITGIPYGNPKGLFIIRFNEGESFNKQALHFNPRFDGSVVVRNDACEDKTFGKVEERHDGFPFKYEQQFKLAIAFCENSFKFAVDGKFFTEFKYRSTNVLSKINGFKCITRKGMNLEITEIDHINLGVADCDGFEKYSDPNSQLF